MRKDETRIDGLLDRCGQPPAPDTDAIVKKTFRRIAARKRSRIIISAVSAAVSAAAVILLAVFLHTYSFSPVPGVPARELNTLDIPYGATATLHLPDGSLMKVNAGSKVIYPDSFKGQERRIFVEGEAYLEVARDRKHPFIVSTEGFDVKVHGTEFNIRTCGDGDGSVVLKKGSVEVSVPEGSGVMLSPGQMASMDNGLISVSEVNTEDHTCWTEGYINLYGETIDKIAARLSEYYGVQVCCKDSTSRLYGKLEFKDSIRDVFKNIGKLVDIDITYSPSKGYTISRDE